MPELYRRLMTNGTQRQTVYRPIKVFHATASADPATLPPLFAKHPLNAHKEGSASVVRAGLIDLEAIKGNMGDQTMLLIPMWTRNIALQY